MNPLPNPPLLVITDRRQARLPLEEIAEAIFAAGGRWLLLREKDLTRDACGALLQKIMAIAAPYEAIVTVSADVDLAETAHGVHLPRDGDVAAARRTLAPTALIGCSAHDMNEATRAAEMGADYVTLSPVFASLSKPGYGPTLRLDGLRVVARNLPIPVVALGGVDADNAQNCLDAGATGVAVMGAVMGAADPGAIVRKLLVMWPATQESGKT